MGSDWLISIQTVCLPGWMQLCPTQFVCVCVSVHACVCMCPSNVTYHLRDKLFLSLLHLSLSCCGEEERSRCDGVKCNKRKKNRDGERERGMNG